MKLIISFSTSSFIKTEGCCCSKQYAQCRLHAKVGAMVNARTESSILLYCFNNLNLANSISSLLMRILLSTRAFFVCSSKLSTEILPDLIFIKLSASFLPNLSRTLDNVLYRRTSSPICILKIILYLLHFIL